MPIVSFEKLMADAGLGKYAVGYFESWNLESLLAVIDAAEAARSPVIVGFSGIFLTHKNRVVEDPPALYEKIAREVAGNASVPVCTLFNESPVLEVVFEAIDRGYGMVMFSDEDLPYDEQVENVARVVDKAHKKSVFVEGEMAALLGVAGEMVETSDKSNLTDPDLAVSFIEKTGIDALAINIGQAHVQGKIDVHLDLERLKEIKRKTNIPLVLHGGSYIDPDEMDSAIELGIRKINVGSIMKRAYLNVLENTSSIIGEDHNIYEVIGSGFKNDILVQARIAVSKVVEELMRQYGSAGRAQNVLDDN